VHLTISSFPELGYNTKILLNLLQSLALSLASLKQHARSIYNSNFHLALSTSQGMKIPFLYTLQQGPKHG
jgi:hypothetical protein